MPDPADPAVIGVDVGGTKIAAGRVVGPDVHEPAQTATDLSSPTALLDGLEATIREVIDRSGESDEVVSVKKITDSGRFLTRNREHNR